jgi:hypothetical protein
VSDPKLAELRPEVRERFSRILEALAAAGYQPKISNALRTEAQQLEKVKQGYAMPGATKPGTHAWGLAADIIDRRWGWNKVDQECAGFFLLLRELAKQEGLTCGGWWFGKGGTAEKPKHRSAWNKFGLGWDVAHVEWSTPPLSLRKPFVGAWVRRAP